jgi:hypothetical protein
MSEFEDALRRQAACADVLAEAEADGNVHLAAQARRLKGEADAAVEAIVANRAEGEHATEASELLEELGVDPKLVEHERPTGAQQLQRYATTGDIDALADALESPDAGVNEALREAAAA